MAGMIVKTHAQLRVFFRIAPGAQAARRSRAAITARTRWTKYLHHLLITTVVWRQHWHRKITFSFAFELGRIEVKKTVLLECFLAYSLNRYNTANSLKGATRRTVIRITNRHDLARQKNQSSEFGISFSWGWFNPWLHFNIIVCVTPFHSHFWQLAVIPISVHPRPHSSPPAQLAPPAQLVPPVRPAPPVRFAPASQFRQDDFRGAVSDTLPPRPRQSQRGQTWPASPAGAELPTAAALWHRPDVPAGRHVE